MRILLAVACAAAVAAAQPKPAQLEYAVVVTRHGVRSPTWTTERLNQYSASPWPDWGVPPGNLTPHGRTLMKIMGDYYRELFSSQGVLGKPDCADSRRAYFWADNDQRTLETARALTETMLPGCPAEVHSAKPGETDPLFDPIEAGFAKPDPRVGLAAVMGRIGPQLDALIDAHRPAFDALTYVLNGNGKAANSIFDQRISISAGEAGVTMAGPLSLASTLSEVFLLEYSNGLSGDKLGWGRLNPVNLRQMLTLHTAYADLMRRTSYLARARSSNLLSHVLRSLEQAATGEPVKGAIDAPGNKLLVISGHDTNISNISGMLDLTWLLPSHQTDDAPPGGALVFSLWRGPAEGRRFVTLQFVVQTLDQMHGATPLSLKKPPATADLFIPACSTAEKGCPCEWSAFLQSVTKSLSPEFVKE